MIVNEAQMSKSHLFWLKIICVFCLMLGFMGAGGATMASSSASLTTVHAGALNNARERFENGGDDVKNYMSALKGLATHPHEILHPSDPIIADQMNANDKNDRQINSIKNGKKRRAAKRRANKEDKQNMSKAVDKADDKDGGNAGATPFYTAADDVAKASDSIDATTKPSDGDFRLSGDSNPGRQWSRIASGNSGLTRLVSDSATFDVNGWLNDNISTLPKKGSKGADAKAKNNRENTRSEGLAGEYQLTLGRMGLDHAVASGIDSGTFTRAGRYIGGVAMIVAYVANYGAFFMLDFFGRFVTYLQPLFWMTKIGRDPSSPLYGFSQFLKQCISYVGQLGMIWAFLFWMITLGLGWLGFRGLTYHGGSHWGGAGRATLIYVMKCICMIVMPVATLALSTFLMSFFSGPFSSSYDDITEQAVDSGFVNFRGWAMNSRLELPYNVKVPSPSNPESINAQTTPSEVIQINGQEAGMSGLSNVPSTTQGQVSKLVTAKDTTAENAGQNDASTGASSSSGTSTSDSSNNNNAIATMKKPGNEDAMRLLMDWMQGAVYTPADWASYAKNRMPGVDSSDDTQVKNALEDKYGNPNNSSSDDSGNNKTSKKPSKSPSKKSSKKSKHKKTTSNASSSSSSDQQNPDLQIGPGISASSGTGASSGKTNFPYINAANLSSTNETSQDTNLSRNMQAGVFEDNGRAKPKFANQPGGLSALGMYNYLATIPNGEGSLKWTGAVKLQNIFTMPEHYDVGLAGTGANAIGNYMRTFGELVSLAVIGLGLMVLAYESIIRCDIEETKNALKTSIGSIAAARALIGMVIAVTEQMIGIWILLRLGRALIVGLVDWISKFTASGLNSGIAMLMPTHAILAAPVTSSVFGAVEALEGVAMMWGSARIVRSGKAITGTILSGVRHTARRWINPMGSQSGHPSGLTPSARDGGGHPLLGGLGRGAAFAAGAHLMHAPGKAAGALMRGAGHIISKSPAGGGAAGSFLGRHGNKPLGQTISPKQVQAQKDAKDNRGDGGKGGNNNTHTSNGNSNASSGTNKSTLDSQNGADWSSANSAADKADNFANGGDSFNGSQADSLADQYAGQSSAIDSLDSDNGSAADNPSDSDVMSDSASDGSFADDSNMSDSADDAGSDANYDNMSGGSSADPAGLSSLADSSHGSGASLNGSAAMTSAERARRNRQNMQNLHNSHNKHQSSNHPHRHNSSDKHMNNNHPINNRKNANNHRRHVAGINNSHKTPVSSRNTSRTIGGHRIGQTATPQEVAKARKGIMSAQTQVRSANQQAANYHMSDNHSQSAKHAIQSRVSAAHNQLGQAARYATAVNMDRPISTHSFSNLVNKPGVTYGKARSQLQNVAAAQKNLATVHHAYVNPTAKSSRQLLSRVNSGYRNGPQHTLGSVYQGALHNYAKARSNALKTGINSSAMSSPRQTSHSLDQIRTHLTTALNANNWDVNDIA